MDSHPGMQDRLLDARWALVKIPQDIDVGEGWTPAIFVPAINNLIFYCHNAQWVAGMWPNFPEGFDGNNISMGPALKVPEHMIFKAISVSVMAKELQPWWDSLLQEKDKK